MAGTAFHCYYGDPSAQSTLHDRFPDKGIWFTECSGSRSPDDPPAKVFRETLTWHSRNVVLGTMRNWARSTANWNIALDSTGGPHNGGCGTCTGLVTVQADGTVTTDAEYYAIGHLAKFVKPGARRIASTSFGTTGWNGQIMDVAFRNPDGSTALVVHNENDAPRSFAVTLGDRTFEYSLPGGALATFVWPASKLLDSKARLHSPRERNRDRVSRTAAGACRDRRRRRRALVRRDALRNRSSALPCHRLEPARLAGWKALRDYSTGTASGPADQRTPPDAMSGQGSSPLGCADARIGGGPDTKGREPRCTEGHRLGSFSRCWPRSTLSAPVRTS
ncbi:glycoside hydrolase family 30 beta sandwich domain-containing protein [Amycolatopsis sp. NPDC051061]|uniref:glycoside hydrolase family 30 protein n=1 Tax=Amycolatopsis sp. NPDC051061 TaxID=3155042 RepID=UPI0034250EBD